MPAMRGAAEVNKVTEAIIGAGIEVHRRLGPGLLESAYRACLAEELRVRAIRVERERPVPVFYRGLKLECAYRLDLLVDDLVIVEIKAIEQVLPVHKAQLLSYLRLSGHPVGLLINFHVTALSRGIHRVVNGPLAVASPLVLLLCGLSVSLWSLC
jgi:GxxExxY protein